MGIGGISEEDWENPKQRSSTCFMFLICFIKWFRCICIFSLVSAACMFIFSEYAKSLVCVNHLSSIKVKKEERRSDKYEEEEEEMKEKVKTKDENQEKK